MSNKGNNWRDGAYRSHGGRAIADAGIPLSKPLQTACARLSQEEIDARKAARSRVEQPGMRKRMANQSKQRISDEAVLQAIREHRAGTTLDALAERLQSDRRLVQAWCDGTNRSHLCDQVDREEWAAKKAVPK